jgi:hypothetical protein
MIIDDRYPESSRNSRPAILVASSETHSIGEQARQTILLRMNMLGASAEVRASELALRVSVRPGEAGRRVVFVERGGVAFLGGDWILHWMTG